MYIYEISKYEITIYYHKFSDQLKCFLKNIGKSIIFQL